MPTTQQISPGVRATPILAGPSPGRQEAASSTPLPPPRPGGEPARDPSPEPQRALIGTTTQQLKQVEHYLPANSRIATYAVSETEQRAALATTGSDSNGRTIAVVYNTPSSENDSGIQPLFLGVLAPKGDGLSLRASARLYGSMIYVSLNDRQAVPFAIRDVTADGRPEIIVTSGVGASLGGALEVYSFDGSSLHQIANVGGHILDLNNKGPGKPSEISAQSRYEAKPRTYRWNGHEFEL